MTRTMTLSVCVICAALGIACGRSDRAGAELDMAGNDIDRTRPEPVFETGCLTASGGRFVLTALETSGDAGLPQPQTEMYQLVGAEEELRQHVGKKVHVAGEAPLARIAEIRELSPPQPVGTSGDADRPQAQVTSESQTRLETRRLRVTSITAAGDCPAAKR